MTEDWLDYQKDSVVYQLTLDTQSVCFVFHRSYPSDEPTRHALLSDDQKYVMTLAAHCLQLVVDQKILVHHDLQVNVESQQQLLTKELHYDQIKELIRAQLA